MTKQNILQDFSLKGVKTMRGHDGQQLSCSLMYKGKKVADFHDDGWGGPANIEYVDQAELLKVLDERQTAEFMLANGWEFMETVDKFTLDDKAQYVIDELFNEQQRIKEEANFKKKMQKAYAKHICWGVPGTGEYAYGGWKIPLAEVVANPKGGVQLVQNYIDKIKKERLKPGEVILNDNLEALGLKA